jgi:MFS family permease
VAPCASSRHCTIFVTAPPPLTSLPHCLPHLASLPPAACGRPVLIGCLPTYKQAGMAAPVLLSLLRLVQGVAVGGELGTAVTFVWELSAAGHKTLGGSVVFVGVTLGILCGISAAMIVNAAIPPSE